MVVSSISTVLLIVNILPLMASGRYADLRGSDTEENRYSYDEPATTLTLRLTTPGDKFVELTLRRSDSVSSNPTTVIGHNGKMSYWKAPEGRSLTVYVNTERHASVVVERRKDNDGKIVKRYRGSFRYAGEVYSLLPLVHRSDRRYRHANTRSSMENQIGGIDHVVSIVSVETLNTREFSLPVTSGKRYFITGDKMMKSDRGLDENRDGKMRYVVELLICVDFALYKSWYEDSQASTEHEKHDEAIAMITHYYAEISSGIDIRYATIVEPDFAIRVNLVGVFIATTAADSPWTEDPSLKVIYKDESYTNMYKGLTRMESWVSEATATFTPFDHAVLFTGNYLFDGTYAESGRPSTKSGLAHMEGVCDKRRRVSINYENGQYSSIQTGAHELAHNLGSRHDAENNECQGKDQYVMSAAPGVLDDTNFKNTFNFSQCSIRYLRAFLGKLTSANTNCLLSNDAKPLIIEHVYPGLVYTVDAQCQFFMNLEESFFCAGGNLEKKMCKQLLCWDPDLKKCVTSSEWRSYVGTTCGNRKWCMKGVCTANSNAPVNNDTCIYGDYKVPMYIDHDVPFMTCSEASVKYPSKCYDTYHADHCCESCVKVRQVDKPGCEYGDRSPTYCNRGQPGDCYDSNFALTCCDFCAKHKNPNADNDCLYGDKASWCVDTIKSSASHCYTQSSVCCEACKKHKTGVSGCEYGDKADWCTQMDLDHNRCKPNDLGENCCGSCSKLFPNGIPVAVTAPPSAGNANCPQGDLANYCSTLEANQCYDAESVCCVACEKFKTGSSDCKYGDKVSWCDGYVDAQECRNPDSAGLCCKTCSQILG